MASLTQRSGQLGTRLAAHLLRRTCYNVSKARIDTFAQKTAAQAVNELFVFSDFALPDGPISHINGIAYMTQSPIPNDINHGGLSNGDKRKISYSWWLNELMLDTSIKGRLANFHKSIWTTGRPANGIEGFAYYRLCLFYAKGSIRELTNKMIHDISMLKYLDNRFNKKDSPNENFAREFLELFTILKGAQISADNYTNYTEADISEAARVLSGCFAAGSATYYNNLDPDTGLPRGVIIYSNHDTGNKQFSSAFNNKVITGAVSEADTYREMEEFVEMIFDQLETAKAYVRRLYTYFVSEIITAEIENDIITPLAIELQANDYVIESVLKKLLKSVHFYDEDDTESTDEIIGSKIKSPLMLFLHTLSYLDMIPLIPDPHSDLRVFWYEFWWLSFVWHFMTPAGQNLYPENVEGHPGYFKEPLYSKNWISTTTIAPRYLFMRYLIQGKHLRNGTITDGNFIPDTSALVANYFTEQTSADSLVNQVLATLLPEVIEGNTTPLLTNKRYHYFREALLGGLSTTNWYFDWQFAQAGNSDSVASVKVALDRLFETVMSSPEYQTF